MRPFLSLILAVMIMLLATLPVAAADITLSDLLSGKIAPLHLQLKELDAGWCRFSLSDSSSSMLNLMLLRHSGGPGADLLGQQAVYYAKGQTIVIREGAFLLAYTPKKKLPQPADLQAMANGPRPPDPLTPDTQLGLTLLDLHRIGSIHELRPFDLKREIRNAYRRPLKDINNESLMRLRLLVTAMSMYSQEHADKLPPMQDAAEYKAALLPYVNNEALFVHPDTEEPYQLNATLSALVESDIKDSDKMVVIFEASPSPDGTRGVVFLNGSVQRVNDEEWSALRKQSGIE
ncbi:MAG: hypothetical protein ACYDBB_08280 [Armatimonadota bacterium]